VSYYAILLSDCKGWNDGRAGEAVKHVHNYETTKYKTIEKYYFKFP